MDPIVYSPKQFQLMELWRYPEKHILVSGPFQCGKSFASTDGFCRWTGMCFSGHLFLVASRTRTQLYENIVPDIERICQQAGIYCKVKKNEKYMDVGNNRFLLYDVADHTAASKLQGVTLAGAFLDDATKINPNFVDQTMGRLSITGAKLLMTCNPEGPSHYIKRMFIDTAHNSRHISFSMMDNPVLDPVYVEDLYRKYTGHNLERNVYGEWAAAMGSIYPFVNYQTGMPTELAEGHWDIAMDCAISSSSHALFIKQHGNRAHVCGEWVYIRQDHGEQPEHRQVATLQAAFEKTAGAGVRPRRVWYDPAAKSFRTELQNRFGKNKVHQAWNDVDLGIEATRHELTSERLTVDNACPVLRKQLETYEYDEYASMKGIDRPVKRDDHGCDALRYWTYSTMKSGAETPVQVINLKKKAQEEERQSYLKGQWA